MEMDNEFKRVNKKISSDQRGTTMVSVIVGFVLLMLLILMFQQVMTLAYNMIKQSQSVREETDILCNDFYKGTTASDTTDSDVMDNTVTFTNQKDTADSFTFKINLNKKSLTDQTIYYFGEHTLNKANSN